jgi:murein DD-endopeptidase MepM/ murein hydrolase activator NlpD
VLQRPAPRHRLPVLGALILAAAAFVLVPSGIARIVPAPPQAIDGRAAGAAPASTPAQGATSGSIGAAEGVAEPPPSGVARVAAVALARIGERASAPAVGSLTGYRWPLAKGRLTLPFMAIPGGEFLNGGKRWHDGIDLASFCNDRVYAAHDGLVLAAGRHFDDLLGWQGDLGPYYAFLDRKHFWPNLPIVLVTDDGNGYRSVYAHFARLVVHVGDRLHAGQLVGYEGRTGHASGCHVHYGLFSALETARFGVRADIAKRLHLPPFEIARVDPLAVMPGGAEALGRRHF